MCTGGGTGRYGTIGNKLIKIIIFNAQKNIRKKKIWDFAVWAE